MTRELHERRHDFEDFVADLTEAAYPVALRHNPERWLELELELWQAMAHAVRKWQQGSQPLPAPQLIAPTWMTRLPGSCGSDWS
jgi:hypothetical protein